MLDILKKILIANPSDKMAIIAMMGLLVAILALVLSLKISKFL
ncbi:hypothetical protein [Methylobacter marinus]|nr:hypothetical protein [Methylobacter marinus]